MSPYLFSLAYAALCGLYMKKMKYSPELPNRILFKVLPLGILVGSTMEYMKQRHTLAIKNSTFPPRIYTVVGGLVFHAMSSVYYEFQSLNFYGILCYAIALIIEIYGFSNSLEYFGNLSDQELVIIGSLAVVSLTIYIYVFPKLDSTNAVLVFLFSFLDTVFLFVLIVHALRFPYGPHYLGVVGAGLRYVSDVLQVLSIWRIPFSYSFEIILSFYYTAQLAILGSVLLPITL